MIEYLRRPRSVSSRDLLYVVLPSLLLLAAGFWLAAQFIRPAPPRQLIISTGSEGGAYQRFAARYKDVLQRYDVNLIEMPSAGSIENLQRLRDKSLALDAGFIQGGTARAIESDTLVSLGSLYYEPLWIFYRTDLAKSVRSDHLDQLAQLRGRRIAIGAVGSGTRKLALELIEANGMASAPTILLETDGLAVVEALQHDKLDAVMVVGPPQSAVVWALLFTDGIRLMSLAHTETYTRLFPHLEKLTLPRGAVDLVHDIPAHDVSLVSPMATLVVRDDTHPALIDLLLQAATEVHGEAGLFRRPAAFPRPTIISHFQKRQSATTSQVKHSCSDFFLSGLQR